jgi:hypothetical protein
MVSPAAIFQRLSLVLALASLALLGGAGATAQELQSIDPDAVIDSDLAPPPRGPVAAPPSVPEPSIDIDGDLATAPPPASTSQAASAASTDPAAASDGTTYQQDDLVGAAEGVFGKGSEGLARMIEDILKKQGEPNGYIVGREGGGAFIFGARYGSGTLFHKVEGQQPVYWRGPSMGLDAGANAGKTFVLVYNLFDTDELFHSYGQGEGQAYLVGGFHVSYLRRKDVVLIPVRMGAGLRLGMNVGYMKFSHKQRWLPF